METSHASFIGESSRREGDVSLKLSERAFAAVLRRLRGGSLRIHFPGGACVVVGDCELPCFEMQIHHPAFFSKVLRGGSIGFGEAYVEGLWDTPDLTGLLSILAKNQKNLGSIQRGFSVVARGLNRLYHRARRNSPEGSRANIEEHYDLSNDFYATFLDRTMTYSSGYFRSPDETLEQAQWNKIDRMLDLSGAQAGDHILEIGTGWGELALRAARRGCKVKTITLSREQFAFAQRRFTEEGLSDRIEIVLQDYRELDGKFDAVLSCEMIEAVGHEYLESYFRIIQNSLKPGAKAVIQTISMPDERYRDYRRNCDWIQKHIFPGGHLPSLGVIEEKLRRAGGMRIEQTISFGLDYAETLKRWSRSFETASGTVRALGFEERFQRKWRYYLSYCEGGFRAALIDVKHIVIKRDDERLRVS